MVNYLLKFLFYSCQLLFFVLVFVYRNKRKGATIIVEDFNTLENLEEYFKKVNCYGEYNYCFTCQMEQSILPILFGAVGAIIEMKRNKNVMGYLFNKFDKGICLIPIVSDTLTKNKVDIDNYIFIDNNDIEKVIAKNEDIVYKKIKIILKNKKRYTMRTLKKIKNIEYHEINLNNFLSMCK